MYEHEKSANKSGTTERVLFLIYLDCQVIMRVPSEAELEKNVKCPGGHGGFLIFSSSKQKALVSEKNSAPNPTTHCWKPLKLTAFPFKIWLIIDKLTAL